MVATGAGSGLTVDTAVHIAQTKGFHGLVDMTAANNQQLMTIADSARAANVGQMSQGFQVWAEDLHNTCIQNRGHLEGIAEALGFGLGDTMDTDEAGLSTFSNMTGTINAMPGSGAHFN